MSNKISQIKTAAGNILTNVSSSGYIYAPYVPLQTTAIGLSSVKKLPSIELNSENRNGKLATYNLAIGKSYEFILNYVKMSKINDDDISFEYDSNNPDHDHALKAALRRHINEFAVGQTIFITEIAEACNNFWYINEYTNNRNDDYTITFIHPTTEKIFAFNAAEFIDLLDQQIIRELT